MTLPEAVVAQSRHSWSDVAVLDANNKAMPFAVSDGSSQSGTDVQLTRLKCIAANEAAEGSSQFRCTAPQPIERAYGVHVSTWPFTHISVDVAPNEHVEFSRDTSVVQGPSEVPLLFSSEQRVETLDVTVEGHPTYGVDVTIASLPGTEPAKRNWHQTRFLWAERNNRRFVYATDFPARAFSVRLGLDRPPNASDHLTIEGCKDAPCVVVYSASVLSADLLLLGRDRTSNPMRFGTFGSDWPFVHVDSVSPLTTPPILELEWFAPKLIFTATGGARPFTLAVGLKDFDGKTRLGLTQQIAMPYGISQAEAGLSEFSPRSQFIARVVNAAGPLLFVVAVLLGLLWAIRPRFSARAERK